jgi:DnaK suppressor protein
MLTKEQIEFFKTELEKRRDRIKKNLDMTSQDMNSMASNDLRDEADFASTSLGRAVDTAIISQQTEELKEIEHALKKIENNTYGICEMCEEEINIERLRVKTFARYCISCREVIEKEQKS